jgi:two-component system NtrC family sensor kinase
MMLQYLQNQLGNIKIRSLLLITLLCISLIPLFLISFLFYKTAKKTIQKEVFQNLNSVAIRQSIEIENFIHNREATVTTLTKDPTIINAIIDFTKLFNNNKMNSNEYDKIEKELFPFFSDYQVTIGFQNIFLASAKGDVIYTLKSGKELGTNLFTGPFKNSDLKKVFDRSTTLLETTLSNFDIYPGTQEPAAFIASPVIQNGIVIGALIAQINNNEMYRVVNDYSGLGKTGETIIVSKIGDNGVFMTPTRFDADAAFKRTFNLQSDKLQPNNSFLLQKILKGNKVLESGIDYRNQNIVGAGYFFLPDLQWGLLVKMDENELFAPLNFMKYLLFATTAILTAAVVLASFLIAKSITEPVNHLIEKTGKISHGDLSQRIEIDSKNEIGQFAQSFNLMAERLENFIKDLDNKVKERTHEVEEKNHKLNETLKNMKSLQEQLIVQEKLASLGQLTAGIAHEIKNPLNFVNNFAELCEKQFKKMQDSLDILQQPMNETEKENINKIVSTIDSNLKKIRQHGLKADSIIRNMLEHSRTGASQNFQSIDINALLEENFKLMYHAKRAEDSSFNIQMKMKFDESIGRIEILPQEIGRVILNLINNAFFAVHQKIKMNPENYFPVVAITTKNLGNKISISFYDNGIGISKEVKEKLFTPFYTTKPPGEGTGLGLSLSREIVVGAHHGELKVDSKEGEYSDFIVILPRKPIE